MRSSIKIAPPNSLVFIAGSDGGKAPYPVRGAMILSTSSCISVGCLPEPDGTTEIILGETEQVDPGGSAAFDGDLDTPDRTIVISTVERETILQTEVPATKTRVRVWLSHPRWPERVIIGWKQACYERIWANDAREPDQLIVRLNQRIISGSRWRWREAAYSLSEFNHMLTSKVSAMLQDKPTYPDDLVIEVLFDKFRRPELKAYLSVWDRLVERTNRRQSV